jgi:hypothetical protein
MLTWRSSTCSCVCAGLSRPISRDGDRAELQHWRMPLRWIPGSCRQPWGATGFQDADHRYAPVPIGQRLQAPRRLGRPARLIITPEAVHPHTRLRAQGGDATCPSDWR